MSDNKNDTFSLDDILKEVGDKKSSKPLSDEESQGEAPDLSVTQILSEQGVGTIKSKAVADMSATQILDVYAAQKAERAEQENLLSQPVEIKRFAPDKKAAKLKAFGKTGPLSGNKKGSRQAATAEVDVVADRIPLEKPPKPTYSDEKQISAEEQLQQEKLRKQKQMEQELLNKELALEDPDDMIDGINPFDVVQGEDPASAEPEPITEVIPPDMFSKVITQDLGLFIPAKHLREGQGVSEPPPHAEELTEAVTPSKLDELNITPVLEKLNKSLKEKRQENINIRTTLNVDNLADIGARSGRDKNKATAVLNIDYKKQIISDSSALPPVGNLKERQLAKQLEEQELRKNRKRKIRDFIYQDIEDEEDDFLYDEDGEDYDSFDSTEQVWQDLNESHRGLKMQLVLLFILCAILGLFTVIHDLGSANGTLEQIVSEWFDGNLTRYSMFLVFANIIAGVCGICICSGAVIRGLKNLVVGKADCDSACAGPIVLTTVASIFFASHKSHGLFQTGQVHLYVLVALIALMLNTLGKIFMIVRTKRNFGLISGDTNKYFAYMPNPDEERAVREFTKGIVDDIPASVFMRKTEFLTDYLKNSYSTDWADLLCRKIVPISVALSLVMGIVAYFLPSADSPLASSIFWSGTVAGALIAAFSPFVIMFVVNNPLLRASTALASKECVVMGYSAASRFSKANSVVIDAGMLFPAGTVRFLNVKRCQQPNAINPISVDDSITIAASLAIETDSIMSSMFFDMIAGNKDILQKVDGCVYEVNMGITGWIGAKRVMLGNREQMKHHGVDVPSQEKESKYCPENADIVYLAVGNESVAMFVVSVVPNPAVKRGLWELDDNGVVFAVKTKDSLVTKARLAEIFELSPERVKILSFDQHTAFDELSKYTSRGDSEISCNGKFTSFAKALVAAKLLMRDIMLGSAILFLSLFIAGVVGLMFVIFAGSGTETLISATNIVLYNAFWLAIMFVIQGIRRY
ncbi:MAG: hypothetical protein FWD35_00790 [Oscillospiraceae bacterium]|nr:hypothetical protein [Oscillospiraceae bacterium]